MDKQTLYDRFQRQIILPNLDELAQQKLLDAKVLVIGAGGLACPCLEYLVRAGVGNIGIVDGDYVTISNLQRQTLYNNNDIGKLKVDCAKERLLNIHPHTNITSYPFFLDRKNCLAIIQQYDIIIDCTDLFSVRYCINDACVLLEKALVFGAVFQYEGQVAVFNIGEKNEQRNLRDIFPTIPNQEAHTTCNEAGILGAVVGIIGTMQALETIKLITNMQGVLANQLLTYHFLHHNIFTVSIPKNNTYTLPMNEQEFLRVGENTSCNNQIQQELNQAQFLEKIKAGNTQVIDVRQLHEMPIIPELNALRIPIDTLAERIHEIDSSKDILLFCHAGIRSLMALEYLSEECGMQKVFHLKGGLLQWKN